MKTLPTCKNGCQRPPITAISSEHHCRSVLAIRQTVPDEAALSGRELSPALTVAKSAGHSPVIMGVQTIRYIRAIRAVRATHMLMVLGAMHNIMATRAIWAVRDTHNLRVIMATGGYGAICSMISHWYYPAPASSPARSGRHGGFAAGQMGSGQMRS